MQTSHSLSHRLAAMAGLAAVVAALVVPAALAGSTAATLADVRSPDMRDAAVSTAQPAAGAALDPAIAAGIRAHENASAPVDGRSPDTKDAPYVTHGTAVTPATTRAGGFAWRDFGFGFAAATGAFLLLVGCVILLSTARSHRSRTSRAATA